MRNLAEDYLEIKAELGCGDTAAAILLLAASIRDSGTFKSDNAQNFGHELACALKNVLEESKIQIVSRNA